jgi:CspA family cold shock protein
MIGVVKFFSSEKGFGFIETVGAPDHFVHVSELVKAGIVSLSTGQRVSFDSEVARNGKGPRAANLALA